MDIKIIELLIEKDIVRNSVMNNSQVAFNLIKIRLRNLIEEMKLKPELRDKVSYKESGNFEVQIQFIGEVLIFTLDNVMYNFDDNHYVHKLDYIKSNPTRGFCSIIKIYNFLSDSFVYNRFNDLGYMIGRLFINVDNHYFMEGKRQLGLLYNDFENTVLDESAISKIIESCLLYTLTFDSLVPLYDEVKVISVIQSLEQHGNAAIRTGKRLGFQFQTDSDIFDK